MMKRRLRIVRFKLKKSQEEMTALVGSRPNVWKQIENGERNASIQMLAKLVTACGVSAHFVLTGEAPVLSSGGMNVSVSE